jgi:transcriptional regulator with XRE-family HTH domain
MFERNNRTAKKLTLSQVAEIRELYAQGATQGQLCRRFSVSVGQIGRIVRGESWASEQVPTSVPRQSDIEASAQRLLRVQAQVQQAPELAGMAAEVAGKPYRAPPPSPLEGADAPGETEGASLSKLNERAAAYGLDIDRLRGAV